MIIIILLLSIDKNQNSILLDLQKQEIKIKEAPF